MATRHKPDIVRLTVIKSTPTSSRVGTRCAKLSGCLYCVLLIFASASCCHGQGAACPGSALPVLKCSVRCGSYRVAAKASYAGHQQDPSCPGVLAPWAWAH